MAAFRPRAQALLRQPRALIWSFALAACTLVGGGIPPSQFHFVRVVAPPGVGEGGWKVAQVAILLNRVSPMFPVSAICDVEVQVPEINYLGPVSDELAQMRAAEAANAAARIVLREPPTMSAVLCMRFRTEMERILKGTGMIPGARVTRFITANVPHTTFPND